MKTCTRCKTEKPLSDFYKNSRRKDGLSTQCKPCSDEMTRQSRAKKQDHYNKLRNDYKRRIYEDIALIKRTSGCKICGENEPVCLDFHHLDPSEKDFSFGSAWGFSEAKLKAEMEKCIIVCKNCHAKIHAGILEVPS